MHDTDSDAADRDAILTDAALDALDPQGIGRAALGVWRAMLARPQAIVEAQLALAAGWTEVATRALGEDGLARAESADRRTREG